MGSPLPAAWPLRNVGTTGAVRRARYWIPGGPFGMLVVAPGSRSHPSRLSAQSSLWYESDFYKAVSRALRFVFSLLNPLASKIFHLPHSTLSPTESRMHQWLGAAAGRGAAPCPLHMVPRPQLRGSRAQVACACDPGCRKPEAGSTVCSRGAPPWRVGRAPCAAGAGRRRCGDWCGRVSLLVPQRRSTRTERGGTATAVYAVALNEAGRLVQSAAERWISWAGGGYTDGRTG